MGIEPTTLDKAPGVKDFTTEMEGMLESVRKNLEKAKEWMKLNANKHCSAAPTYKIGQQVWLAIENLAGLNAIKLQLSRSTLLSTSHRLSHTMNTWRGRPHTGLDWCM